MSVIMPTAYPQRYGTQKTPLQTVDMFLMDDNSIKGTYLGDVDDEPYEFNLFYQNLTESQANEFNTAYNNSMNGDPDITDVNFPYDPEGNTYNGYFLERPILTNVEGNTWNVSIRMWGILP